MGNLKNSNHEFWRESYAMLGGGGRGGREAGVGRD